MVQLTTATPFPSFFFQLENRHSKHLTMLTPIKKITPNNEKKSHT